MYCGPSWRWPVEKPAPLSPAVLLSRKPILILVGDTPRSDDVRTTPPAPAPPAPTAPAPRPLPPVTVAPGVAVDPVPVAPVEVAVASGPAPDEPDPPPFDAPTATVAVPISDDRRGGVSVIDARSRP